MYAQFYSFSLKTHLNFTKSAECMQNLHNSYIDSTNLHKLQIDATKSAQSIKFIQFHRIHSLRIINPIIFTKSIECKQSQRIQKIYPFQHNTIYTIYTFHIFDTFLYNVNQISTIYTKSTQFDIPCKIIKSTECVCVIQRIHTFAYNSNIPYRIHTILQINRTFANNSQNL